MEPYDPMMTCDLNGYYYCIQNNHSKTIKADKPMMAYISKLNEETRYFYGTLYECLDFCENYDNVPILI